MIDGDNKIRPKQPEPVNPPPPPQPKTAEPANPPQKTVSTTNPSTRLAEVDLRGSQQRDRIERLYGAGAAGLSSMRDVALERSANRANRAYFETYQRELANLRDPSRTKNAPAGMIDVAARAENAYRSTLASDGFTPSDVRGQSAIKAADYLRNQSRVPGDFTTLAPDQIRGRINSNTNTDYFVRILDGRYLASPDSRPSAPNSPHTWVATPQEISGAKLDVYETMRRVGYSDNYITQIRSDVAAGKRNLSDFTLVLSEANGNTGRTQPNWNTLTDRARSNPAFVDFASKGNDFWKGVQSLDYSSELRRFNADNHGYLSSLTPEQRDVFTARQRMDRTLGVNEFFTNDGRTARTDGRNGTYGVREFLLDNNMLRDTQRHTFLPLNETGKTDLRSVNRVPAIADAPLRLGREFRSGSLAGGVFSAATSLPQVFDQARRGDYLGAARTLGTNTALGTAVGGTSAAGERIIGQYVERSLSNSQFARAGIDRLYSSTAARSVAARLVQTEASSMTSSAFGSTVRQFGGRLAGGSIVGGVVNGAFSAYDQIGAYRRGEVTGSQAIGTVAGETAVGLGAGLAGAAAGAAIGSIIPGAGTIVGGVIGFGVGVAAGYLADKGLRGLGVNTAIAKGVTWAIDNAPRAAAAVGNFVGSQVKNARQVAGAVSTAARAGYNYVSQRATTAARQVSAATRSAVNYVAQTGRAAVNTVRNTVSNAASAVRSTVSRAAASVTNTVSNIAESARSTVSNLAGGAVSSLKSVFGF